MELPRPGGPRFFRAKGHEVSCTRLYATSWVLGVIGISWQMGVAIFLLFGGADGLADPIWRFLISDVGSSRPMAWMLFAAGAAGVAGIGFDIRWLSLLSSLAGFFWNGVLAFYLFLATLAGEGNLIVTYAVLAAAMFGVRFSLLLVHPTPSDTLKLG